MLQTQAFLHYAWSRSYSTILMICCNFINCRHYTLFVKQYNDWQRDGKGAQRIYLSATLKGLLSSVSDTWAAMLSYVNAIELMELIMFTHEEIDRANTYARGIKSLEISFLIILKPLNVNKSKNSPILNLWYDLNPVKLMILDRRRDRQFTPWQKVAAIRIPLSLRTLRISERAFSGLSMQWRAFEHTAASNWPSSNSRL